MGKPSLPTQNATNSTLPQPAPLTITAEDNDEPPCSGYSPRLYKVDDNPPGSSISPLELDAAAAYTPERNHSFPEKVCITLDEKNSNTRKDVQARECPKLRIGEPR